jgi:DNA-binding winged helix-turn-helix (wHTH) protein
MGGVGSGKRPLQCAESRGLEPGHVQRLERRESQAAFVVLVSNAFDSPLGIGRDVEVNLKLGIVPYEIVDQIRSLLCQAGLPEERIIVDPRDEVVERGAIRLTAPNRIVTIDGYPLDLTATQFDLLEILMRAAGRVLSREYLTRTVLNKRLTQYDRSIDVHVGNLRKKLRTANGEDCIRTIRGVGYLYVDTRPENYSPSNSVRKSREHTLL